mmetsp:Transcript_10503/g.42844  ORF Transcript_10503/g.42844 Transcript_10503/m.42844 type:complete len:598 (+) Transcript_10503:2347-4140(+)
MEEVRAAKLGEVAVRQEARVVDQLLVGLEVQLLVHLHLRHNAAGLVLAVVDGVVLDLEGEGVHLLDLAGDTVIQLFDARDLREGDPAAVAKVDGVLVDNVELARLVNRGDDVRPGCLAVGVGDGEAVAKVGEERAVQALNVRLDVRDRGRLLAAELVEADRVCLAAANVNKHSVLRNQRLGELAVNCLHLDRGVQLPHAAEASDGPVLAHVLLAEVKVRAQIAQRRSRSVVEGHSAHSGEDDVLGDLCSKAVHAGDQHVGDSQLLHGLATVHCKLPAVEVLVQAAEHVDHVAQRHHAKRLPVRVHDPHAVDPGGQALHHRVLQSICGGANDDVLGPVRAQVVHHGHCEALEVGQAEAAEVGHRQRGNDGPVGANHGHGLEVALVEHAEAVERRVVGLDRDHRPAGRARQAKLLQGAVDVRVELGVVQEVAHDVRLRHHSVDGVVLCVHLVERQHSVHALGHGLRNVVERRARAVHPELFALIVGADEARDRRGQRGGHLLRSGRLCALREGRKDHERKDVEHAHQAKRLAVVRRASLEHRQRLDVVLDQEVQRALHARLTVDGDQIALVVGQERQQGRVELLPCSRHGLVPRLCFNG